MSRSTPESLARRLEAAVSASPGALTDSERTTAMRLLVAIDRQGRLTNNQMATLRALTRRIQRRANG